MKKMMEEGRMKEQIEEKTKESAEQTEGTESVRTIRRGAREEDTIPSELCTYRGVDESEVAVRVAAKERSEEERREEEERRGE
jgi:hypothetical protein